MASDSDQFDDLIKSPFNDLLGFRIAHWQEDRVVLELTLEPHHLNRSGVVHGGVLASLADAAGGFAGCFCAVAGNVRRALTLSMTTNFTGQSKSGTIKVVGVKKAGGRKIFFASVEIFNSEDELIALAEGTYRYRSGSETADGVPL